MKRFQLFKFGGWWLYIWIPSCLSSCPLSPAWPLWFGRERRAHVGTSCSIDCNHSSIKARLRSCEVMEGRATAVWLWALLRAPTMEALYVALCKSSDVKIFGRFGCLRDSDCEVYKSACLKSVLLASPAIVAPENIWGGWGYGFPFAFLQESVQLYKCSCWEQD